MEGMEETKKSEAHLTSAAAFVEGGIQDACDDACSICLEAFCDSDPSTVTSCKHEFHLQCILEWCQRSSQCPMCWQPISLKDATSQELLEAVEHERSFRFNPSRNATIFHHPTLGDFELQHLPVGANDTELEERIIQHLAAAAAMGRRHIARREGQRNRSSAQGRPQFLVFSSHPNAPAGPISSSPTQREEGESVSTISVPTPLSPPMNVREESLRSITPQSSDVQADPAFASASGSSVLASNQHENSLHNRYKESISKSTRGWKERFFSRSSTMADLGSEVRREVNAGIATVSRMMERLETRENNRTSTSASNNEEDSSVSVTESNNQQISETGGGNPTSNTNTNMQAPCAASSGSD